MTEQERCDIRAMLERMQAEGDQFGLVARVNRFARMYGISAEEAVFRMRQGWTEFTKQPPEIQRAESQAAAIEAGFVTPDEVDRKLN